MTTKRNSFINIDLDFAEEQLAKWKQWLLDNPYDKIEDRKEMQKTKTGGAFLAVVQTKEAIQKVHRDTLKDYLAMCDVLEKLRQAEETKSLNIKGKDEDSIPFAIRQKLRSRA